MLLLLQSFKWYPPVASSAEDSFSRALPTRLQWRKQTISKAKREETYLEASQLYANLEKYES